MLICGDGVKTMNSWSTSGKNVTNIEYSTQVAKYPLWEEI